jgi:hypothetical protein
MYLFPGKNWLYFPLFLPGDAPVRKKEKLYITDIVDEPHLIYPSYYLLSPSLIKNEMLHAALAAIHNLDFHYYHPPKEYSDIFQTLDSGAFPLYKEKYVVGCFGGRIMFLESSGWRTMPVTKDVFALENWLLP